MATNDHGSCPNCGVSFNGDGIWDTGLRFALAGKLYEQDGVPAKDYEEACALADGYAQSYGASREGGERFGRQIGIYSYEKDRTVSWKCPDCGHRWARGAVIGELD